MVNWEISETQESLQSSQVPERKYFKKVIERHIHIVLRHHE